MPLPKGINDPGVRVAWVAERKAKLAEFDRLVGQGLSEAKASRRLGLAPGGLAAMRRSIELLEEGRQYGRGQGADIDLGLALLSCLRKPGEELTSEDIAAWCNCSRAAIQSIEKKALQKVRQRFAASIRNPEAMQELQRLVADFG